MRYRSLLVVGAALAIVPLAVAAEAPAGPDTPLVPGKGIYLLVRSGIEGISLLRVAGSRAPRDARKPSLTLEDWQRHPPGTEELVVTLHDNAGGILGAYGFPVRHI